MNATPATDQAVNAPLEAVDYSRISDDDTGKGAGVDRQANRNAEVADRRGVPLVARFRDNNRSASQHLDQRDDFRAMLAHIADHDTVRYVIAWHPDRLLRSVTEGEEFISLCRRRGVIVLTAMAGEFDLETAYGRKAFRDAVNGAAYESEHRGERVAEARHDGAKNGDYHGGVRPYGWGKVTDLVQRVQVDVRDQDGNVILDDNGNRVREWVNRPFVDMTQHNPDEAAVIRSIAEQLLTGVSTAEVTRDLNRRGVPTAAQADGRKIRRNGQVLDPGPWSARSIWAIVTNPRVSGHSVHNGKIVKRDAWDAIIPEHQREVLVTMSKDPGRKTSPGNTPRWLGSLIYRCGECDDGTTYSVRYRGKAHRPAYECRSGIGHNRRWAEPLDDLVTGALLAYIDTHGADLVDTPPDVDTKALQDEHRALGERLKAKVREHALGEIDDELYAVAKDAVDQRRREINAQLRKAATTSTPAARLANAVEGVTRAWERLTVGEARQVLKSTLVVTLVPGGINDVDAEHVRIEPA